MLQLTFFHLGMFTVNRLTEKNSVNRFSINRTETDKMAVNLLFSKSRFIYIVDDTNLTLNGDAASFSSMY